MKQSLGLLATYSPSGGRSSQSGAHEDVEVTVAQGSFIPNDLI
jgi:hypothetical protein